MAIVRGVVMLCSGCGLSCSWEVMLCLCLHVVGTCAGKLMGVALLITTSFVSIPLPFTSIHACCGDHCAL